MRRLKDYLARIAARYLERRGNVVLPFPFVGMAIGGNAVAMRHADGVSFTVTLAHPRARLIVLTGSQLIDAGEARQ
jgi:hypothetical protein